MEAPTLSLSQVKRYVAGYLAALPRTLALEQRIKIGTGFHGKWYRSQKEHQLGWIVFQECAARKKNLDPDTVPASGMWSRLKCSPSMFWYAEAVGVAPAILDAAEAAAERAAAINPKDGNPHGKLMREVLPWNLIAQSMLDGPEPPSAQQAASLGLDAFDRLTELRSEYRKWSRFLP